MANDIHYLWIFVVFFELLAILAPLLNAEFNTGITEGHNLEGAVPDSEPEGSVIDYFSAAQVLFNLFVFPFWTFGLPSWVNLSVLLIIRIMFLALIGRNIWIGGGG